MNNNTANLESVLSEYYRAASPDDSFARRLETRLTAAHPGADRVQPAPRGSAVRLRLAVIGIILALSLTLALIGPDRVWATIQRLWQRYIPGIGLVEETSALALAKPAAYTEAGVTFEVQEFVATDQKTRLIVIFRGLPEDAIVDPDSIWVELSSGNRLRMSSASYGRVWPACGAPGCQGAEEKPTEFRMGFVLDPLPPGENSARVVWKTGGLVPGSAWTDRWILEFPLSPLADAKDFTVDQLVYSPDASLSTGEMTFSVINVIQAADRTVLDLEESMPGREAFAQIGELALIDDQGRRYDNLPAMMDLDEHSQHFESGIAAESTEARRYSRHYRSQFEPVAPDAKTLTLEIGSMNPRADADGSFDFELPETPEEGDRLPVNQSFEVAGGVLRVASVRFVNGTVVSAPRDEPSTTLTDQLLIEVELEVVEPPPGGLYKVVELKAGWTGPSWIYPDPTYSESSGVRVRRLVYDPDKIWRNQVSIHLDNVTVYREGPWTLHWDIPGR